MVMFHSYVKLPEGISIHLKKIIFQDPQKWEGFHVTFGDGDGSGEILIGRPTVKIWAPKPSWGQNGGAPPMDFTTGISLGKGIGIYQKKYGE